MILSMTEDGRVFQPQTELPVREKCDVLVVGGGTAGCMAAIASARNGAATVLVEGSGTLGGEMINGATSLHSFFNSFVQFPEAGEKKIVEGLPQELIDRMTAAGGSKGHVRVEPELGGNYDPYCTAVDHEIMKAVLAEMMDEAHVHVLLHTMVAEVLMEGRDVAGIVIETKSGREAILSEVTIDCTGDGDVAHFAGVPETELYSQYAVGMTFGIGGVDLNKAAEFFDSNDLWLSKGKSFNKESGQDEFVRFGFQLPPETPSPQLALRPTGGLKNFMNKKGGLGTTVHNDAISYINFFGFGQGGVNPTDVEELSQCELTMRKEVVKIADYLRKYAPGFEDCYISWTSQKVCPRASRQFYTEYELSNEEICQGKKFPDEFGYTGFHDLSLSGHPIKDGGYVGLPYRMLLPKEVGRLLLAGRMVTTEKTAHQCTRIGVACMQMGQAAGTAAALCIREKCSPKGLDSKILQKCLKENGVYLEDNA